MTAQDIRKTAARNLLEQRWEATVRTHTCLLGWNDGRAIPDPLDDNGTCCLIQSRFGRFVITCEHVWRGYEAFRNKHAQPRLWMSLVKHQGMGAPSSALVLTNARPVAVDRSLDLAVFTFAEISALEAWRFWQFQPLGKVTKGEIVHFLGFPGEALRQGAAARQLNYCFCSHAVYDPGYTKFLLHSAPGKIHHENHQGEASAPFRICGASGAPVFKVDSNLELTLSGVVTDLSSGGLAGTATEGYEMSDGDIYVTHACFIQEDGSIVPV